ncbi:MAG: hypothetical protein K8S54_03795 [Spirochaetia bacterium]|nr:hypothetical protein [Spirochaetia bacterium]
MSEPVLVAFLFADRVITEDNQKKGIIGTFTRFHSQQFPVSFPLWFIYTAITNISPGKHPMGITITSIDTKQVILSVNADLDASSPGNLDDVVELSVPVVNVVFPQEGKYDVSVVMDGETLGSRSLLVNQISAPPI